MCRLDSLRLFLFKRFCKSHSERSEAKREKWSAHSFSARGYTPYLARRSRRLPIQSGLLDLRLFCLPGSRCRRRACSPRARAFFPLRVRRLALDGRGRTRRTRAFNRCTWRAFDDVVVRSFLHGELLAIARANRARDCERLPECDPAQHASDDDYAC